MDVTKLPSLLDGARAFVTAHTETLLHAPELTAEVTKVGEAFEAHVVIHPTPGDQDACRMCKSFVSRIRRLITDHEEAVAHEAWHAEHPEQKAKDEEVHARVRAEMALAAEPPAA